MNRVVPKCKRVGAQLAPPQQFAASFSDLPWVFWQFHCHLCVRMCVRVRVHVTCVWGVCVCGMSVCRRGERKTHSTAIPKGCTTIINHILAYWNTVYKRIVYTTYINNVTLQVNEQLAWSKHEVEVIIYRTHRSLHSLSPVCTYWPHARCTMAVFHNGSVCIWVNSA